MTPAPAPDAFLPQDVGVTEPYYTAGADAIIADALSPFVTALTNDITQGGDAGWIGHMQPKDMHSTRSYLSLNDTGYTPTLAGVSAPLSSDVVNWVETFDKSTGWYDRSLTETVLEAMAFGAGSEAVDWFCIE